MTNTNKLKEIENEIKNFEWCSCEPGDGSGCYESKEISYRVLIRQRDELKGVIV